MDANEGTLTCGTHGPALPPGFLCRHLRAGDGRGWNQAAEPENELCPDAWCDACAAEMADGIWDEVANVTLVCACCYHRLRGRQHARASTWDAIVGEACRSMQQRNDDLRAAGVLTGARWRYTSEPLVLELLDGERVLSRSRCLMLGSWNADKGTFLWGWANHSIAAVDRAPVAHVAGWGSASGITELTEELATCAIEDAWERAAVGAWVLGAQGIYRCPSEPLHTFLALMDVELVAPSG